VTKQLIRKSNGDTIPGSMVETVSWREIRAVEIPREDYQLLCEREMEAARKIRLNSKSDNLGGPAIRCYDSRHMARGMLEMYVGRIVAVGCNQRGDPVAAYRVSSRSFSNRSAEQVGDTVRIVAHAGSADAVSDSPYIAYECLIWNSRFAVVSNGTHTRPIYERRPTRCDR
jgi:hypothetical protein